MGFGASLFLIAVGAILTFAVDVTVQGLDLDAVGVILMVVGGIGLVASWCSGPAGEGSAAVAVATPSSRKTPTTGRSPELERWRDLYVVLRRTGAALGR